MKYKILAVDDISINLKLLSRALVNSNYHILTADSGQKAFEIAVNEKPDLILLDVMMPDMDGYEVCNKLQDREDTAHIPIIFLTAKNESVDKAKGFALGAIDYLTKPFDPLDINARVRNHLNRCQRTIKLARKNSELSEKLKKHKDGEATHPEFLSFLSHLPKKSVELEEWNYQFYACTKTKKGPVSDGIMAYPLNSLQFIYMAISGFERTYSALIVQLLIEQFLSGFSIGFQKQKLVVDDVDELFNHIMDNFSPDIYKAPFTFSLNFVDLNEDSLYTYNIHHPRSFLVTNSGLVKVLSGKKRPVQSKYAKLLSAERVSLARMDSIFHYQLGQKSLEKDEVEKRFAGHFLKARSARQRFTNICDVLEETESDRVLALIHLGKDK